MLNSHTSIYTEEEIFGWLKERTIEDVINSIYSRVPFSIQAVGFKVFYYHPEDDDS